MKQDIKASQAESPLFKWGQDMSKMPTEPLNFKTKTQKME
jgi:hypothetical protein